MRTLASIVAFLSAAEPALAHHVIDGKMPTSSFEGLMSGLGHPIIGLDHLAAVIAVGCLAASQWRGALMVIGYVVAMVIGAAAHIGEATVAGAEIFVALSVVALGLVLVRARPLRTRYCDRAVRIRRARARLRARQIDRRRAGLRRSTAISLV